MDVLILDADKVVRDHVRVGLQNFPEFAVDTGQGFAGLNLTEQKDYDCLFIACDPQTDQGLELIENFRKTNNDVDVVMVTPARKSKAHQHLRTRYDLFSILYVPLDPGEFFRLVARLRRREAAY